jgi:hypothetical protein
MMRKSLCTLVVFVLSTATLFSFHKDAHAEWIWSNYGDITYIEVNSGPQPRVMFNVANISTGCRGGNSVILVGNSDGTFPDGMKNMYAMILSANAAGKQIRVYWDSASACHGSSKIITYVSIN